MVCGSSTFAAGKFAGKYLASRGRMSIDFNLCAGKFAGDLLQGACARLDGPLSAPLDSIRGRVLLRQPGAAFSESTTAFRPALVGRLLQTPAPRSSYHFLPTPLTHADFLGRLQRRNGRPPR